MTKSAGCIINRIGVTIICIACFLPKVYLFTDKLILPKFYLCILGWSVLAVSNSIINLKSDNNDGFYSMLRFGKIAYALAACMECLYVLYAAISLDTFSLAQSGTFDNPAGLALSICVALPYTAWKAASSHVARTKAACAIISLLYCSVIVMSGSRTGLLSAALCLTCLLLHIVRSRMSGKRWVKPGTAIFAALMIGAVVTHVCESKRDSTNGRSFILRRSLEMAMERPVAGWGTGGFEREYMLKQAAYFSNNPNSEYAMLADEVQHPLNEFMYVQVNHGIVGTLFLVTALLVPAFAYLFGRKRAMRPLMLPLLTVTLFSCFSYPFHYPVAWMVVGLAWTAIVSHPICMKPLKRKMSYGILLFSGLAAITVISVDAYHETLWHSSLRQSVRGKHTEAMKGYEAVYDYFRNDRYFLYSYSMAAFMASDFDRAYQLAEECGKCWSSYNVQLLSGDICFYKHDYNKAVRHFQTASMMCPARFAPLEGLYKVYDQTGDTAKMDSVSRLISEKSVKVVSSDVYRIKDACKRQYNEQ